jgi:hypothetical protein
MPHVEQLACAMADTDESLLTLVRSGSTGDVIMTDSGDDFEMSGTISRSGPRPSPASTALAFSGGSPIVHCPLFRLPAELREKIYYYTLATETPIAWPSGEKASNNLGLGLLRTCKPIFHEAAPALYEYNVLKFKHPSDANMFLFNHHVQLAQHVRTLLLHISDRDISLWTGYLGSSSSHRSLLHDFPLLEELYIVLRSVVPLTAPGHDIAGSYKRWQGSTLLTNLCGCLRPRVEDGISVKVLFARFATDLESEILFQAHPDHFLPDRLRTKWGALYGSKVALDATVVNNPWYTGELF